jgi:hypothetical protein
MARCCHTPSAPKEPRQHAGTRCTFPPHPPPSSLFLSLFRFPHLFIASLHSSSPPPLSPSVASSSVRPPSVHRFEEVYVAPSVRTVRPAQLSHWDLLIPEQLEPVFDLRQRSRFHSVELFHITTIWLIDNYDSVNVVNFLFISLSLSWHATAYAREGKAFRKYLRAYFAGGPTLNAKTCTKGRISLKVVCVCSSDRCLWRSSNQH